MTKGECDVWDQVGEPEDEGRGACSEWVGNLPYLLQLKVYKFVCLKLLQHSVTMPEGVQICMPANGNVCRYIKIFLCHFIVKQSSPSILYYFCRAASSCCCHLYKDSSVASKLNSALPSLPQNFKQ